MRMDDRPALPASVILVLGLAILLNYVDRGTLAIAAPLIQDELSLSSAQIGVLLSAFFWAYAPSQILAGWLVHRYDVRLVLAGGILLWSLATATSGLAGGFASMLVFRLLLGLGESVTYPGWNLILSRHTAEHDRGRANGLVTSGQGFGPMVGTLFGGLAMASFGWRAMFVGVGLITLLWLWPWFVVSRRAFFHRPQEEAAATVPYRTILRRRAFWGAALGQFAANYSFYFLMTWLPSFLVKAGGFTVPEMAKIGGIIFGIYGLSTVISGAASDRWLRRGASPTLVRKTFMLASAFGVGLTIAASAWVEPRSAVWLIAAAGIFFGVGGPMIFAIGATLAGPRAAGRWGGAQNLAGQVAGILAPLVTGLIVDRTGSFSGAFVVAAASAVGTMVAYGLVLGPIEEVEWQDEEVMRVMSRRLA
jgi:MFS family permease